MKLNYNIHPRENLYLFIQIAISCMIYCTIGLSFVIQNEILMSLTLLFLSMGFYIGFILWLQNIFLVGIVRGNSVRASSKQFSTLFNIVEKQSKALGFKQAPKVYVFQSGGMINTFAARFLRKYYVVLFAPVVEEAYKKGEDVLSFIVGHELGHIQRNHLALWKLIFTFPSIIIPFLYASYARACEYTCDRIGYALAPKGAITGIGLLAVGPNLYKQLDVQTWLSESEKERGFPTWISELFLTHPHLINRIKALDSLEK